MAIPSVTGKATKPIRILLVNPNATEFMTTAMMKGIEAKLPDNVTVYGMTSPEPAPLAIEGHLDAVFSAAAAARAIIPIAGNYDAVLVACFSDHPLTKALREELDQPVIGIMEAALLTGRMLGARFGIVSVAERSVILHQDGVYNYGLQKFCAGVEHVGLSVLELESRPEAEVWAAMSQTAQKLVGMGADSICLGCAGMVGTIGAVQKAVGPNVRVLDGVECGVHLLIALVQQNLHTAKKGAFASSAEARDRRGQKYL